MLKPGNPRHSGYDAWPDRYRRSSQDVSLSARDPSRPPREVPAYALTVAKGSPRLAPFHEDECLDLSKQSPNGKPLCGRPLQRKFNSQTPGRSPMCTIPGTNAAGLANTLRLYVERPVVDRTEGFGGMLRYSVWNSDWTQIFRRFSAGNCNPAEARSTACGSRSFRSAIDLYRIAGTTRRYKKQEQAIKVESRRRNT